LCQKQLAFFAISLLVCRAVGVLPDSESHVKIVCTTASALLASVCSKMSEDVKPSVSLSQQRKKKKKEAKKSVPKLARWVTWRPPGVGHQQ